MDSSPPGSSVHGISQARKNGLPFPSPGNLPDSGIEISSLALQAESLPLSPWEAHLDLVDAKEQDYSLAVVGDGLCAFHLR